ncbi:MAG: type IV toxin-antitoxin system AbiEi family antitoxin [Comamonas sp.]
MNDSEILHSALQATRSLANFQLEGTELRSGPWGDAMARLMLADGRSEVFGVEVKRVVDRLETLRFLHEHAQHVSRPLLVVPYLSPQLAQECQRLGLNFIDMAGNVHIDAPGHFVFVSGNPRPKAASAVAQQGALRTANGLRVIFALLTQPDLVSQTQRDIAAHAGVALGSVGRALEDLQQLGHLSPGKGPTRRLLAVDELMRTWVQHYRVSLRHKLQPRRYSLFGNKSWQDIELLPGDAVWGAEAAVHRMNGYIQPVEATIYSWVPRQRFIVEHRLRPEPQGNVEVLDAFWNSPSRSDSLIAPTLLVYADLMGSPDGRSREVAAMLWKELQHA